MKLLQELFQFVLVIEEVEIEFGKLLPDWFIIKKVKNSRRKEELKQIVDEGEASAIALALETKNALLIIDEKKGENLLKALILK